MRIIMSRKLAVWHNNVDLFTYNLEHHGSKSIVGRKFEDESEFHIFPKPLNDTFLIITQIMHFNVLENIEYMVWEWCIIYVCNF